MSILPINVNPRPPVRGDKIYAKDVADLWQAVKRLAAKKNITKNVATQISQRQFIVSIVGSDKLSVTGGMLSTNGDEAGVNIVNTPVDLTVVQNGYVVIKILRNASTRKMSAVPLISYVDGALPLSTQQIQVLPLAKITITPSIAQVIIEKNVPLIFDDLHIFEELVVLNGEFKFADILTASRNTYSLPAP